MSNTIVSISGGDVVFVAAVLALCLAASKAGSKFFNDLFKRIGR